MHFALCFCIQNGLGYSSSQSYERINAKRIAFKVAAVGEKLKTGELSLTTAARRSSHMKRENLPATKVVDLVELVAGKSVCEVERVLAGCAAQPVPYRKRYKMAATITPRPMQKAQDKFRTSGKNLRYTANADRRFVWQRADSTCEFVSRKTGLRCGSKQSLEIDHIKPVARGGLSTLNNLQLLCRAHNQWKGAS